MHVTSGHVVSIKDISYYEKSKLVGDHPKNFAYFKEQAENCEKLVCS